MNPYYDNIFLTITDTIGDSVLAYIQNLDDLFERSKKASTNKIEDLSIYTGLSGLIFFLIEIHKYTKNKKYFSGASLGCKYIEKCFDHAPSTNLSFYAGTGGVIYIFIEMYKLSNDTAYLSFAKKIAKNNNKENHSDDIFNGTAGEILTLLHLHNELKEEWLLEKIKGKIDLLLSKIIVTKKGICWGISPTNMQSLCGFSHGSSGIAFVFIELARYFNNNTFYWIAQNAFNYENEYLDRKINNWPDFRQDVYSAEAIEHILFELKGKDVNDVIKPRYLSYWCHGAPGIGIAHLYAYKFSKNEEHLYYFKVAVKNIFLNKSSLNNKELCHGLCGNVNLLIDAYITTGESQFYEKAKQIAMKLSDIFLKQNYSNPSDISLFLGCTGIGYFYLRLLDPHHILPILTPYINSINSLQEFAPFDHHYLIDLVSKNIFKNTFNSNKKFKIEIYSHNPRLTIKENLIWNIREKVKGNSYLQYLFELDMDVIDFSSKTNYSYAYVYSYANKSKTNKEYRELNNIEISKFIQVNNYRWNDKDVFILLQAIWRFPGIKQFEIDEFTYHLIKSFQFDSNIKSVKYFMQKKFDTSAEYAFEERFHARIRDCIKNEFIIIKN